MRERPIQWKKIPGGVFGGRNEVIECDKFYVSYNPWPCGNFRKFQSDDGGPETALVVDGKFYILNGDFRKQYAKAFPQGLSACMGVFEAHRDSVSSWSDK